MNVCVHCSVILHCCALNYCGSFTSAGSGFRVIISKCDNCNVSEVTDFMIEYVGSAYLDNQVESELTYVLGLPSNGRFPLLFEALAANTHRLKIKGYVVTETTMDEIFNRSVTHFHVSLSDQFMLSLKSALLILQ